MSLSARAIEAYTVFLIFLYFTGFSMPLTPFEHHLPYGISVVIGACLYG